MNQLDDDFGYRDEEKWNDGLANHERLKKLLPFMNEDEGYL